jgi:hypothetical protein
MSAIREGQTIFSNDKTVERKISITTFSTNLKGKKSSHSSTNVKENYIDQTKTKIEFFSFIEKSNSERMYNEEDNISFKTRGEIQEN